MKTDTPEGNIPTMQEFLCIPHNKDTVWIIDADGRPHSIPHNSKSLEHGFIKIRIDKTGSSLILEFISKDEKPHSS